MKNRNRLYRLPAEGKLGGVCAGLARYTDIPAGRVRLAAVLLTLAASAGLWAYLVLWILLPAEKNDKTHRS